MLFTVYVTVSLFSPTLLPTPDSMLLTLDCGSHDFSTFSESADVSALGTGLTSFKDTGFLAFPLDSRFGLVEPVGGFCLVDRALAGLALPFNGAVVCFTVGLAV